MPRPCLIRTRQDLTSKKPLFSRLLVSRKEWMLCTILFLTLVLKSLFSKNRLHSSDLITPLMTAIFHRNIDAALEELNISKKSGQTKQYDHDLTLAFWFAIHLEDLRLAQTLVAEAHLLK